MVFTNYFAVNHAVSQFTAGQITEYDPANYLIFIN